jgi:carboxypeptidase Taq
MGIHESQSLAFEMQLGCSLAFAEFLSPRLVEAFGPQEAFEPRALQAHLTRVQPGFIRVEADEVCYPAHVILRYRIERDLVERRMAIEDIPSRWEESMRHFLGLEVGEQHGKGCLQDIHWPEGLIGYFPSYTLGAMYAAQWFASIRSSHPDLDAQIRQGQFASIHQWLRRNIWEAGSLYSTDELALRASGETLNPAHFKQHLTHRYLG